MVVRLAQAGDIPAIARLIEASVRGLQADDYSPEQIEAALGDVFGVDKRLIEDETYFVVETDDAMVGCGGWSRRRTLFGADAVHGRDDAELIPGQEAAKIRAFFVAPAYARRGVATRLLAACEDAARTRGFTELELGATLTGEPFYARHGYSEVARMEAPLAGALSLPIVRMAKRLEAA